MDLLALARQHLKSKAIQRAKVEKSVCRGLRPCSPSESTGLLRGSMCDTAEK